MEANSSPIRNKSLSSLVRSLQLFLITVYSLALNLALHIVLQPQPSLKNLSTSSFSAESELSVVEVMSICLTEPNAIVSIIGSSVRKGR